MGSGNEGHSELIWGNLRGLVGLAWGGNMGKERKWKAMKVKISWSQFVKYAHRRDRTLSCGQGRKRCNTGSVF